MKMKNERKYCHGFETMLSGRILSKEMSSAQKQSM